SPSRPKTAEETSMPAVNNAGPQGNGGSPAPVASSVSRQTVVPPALNPAPPASQRSTLPRLQYVNSRQVTLDYQVNKCGSSGVGNVELYVTSNDGQRWEPYAIENDNPSQFPAEGRQGGSLQRSLRVQLPGEGRFGFYLIVKSGLGKGKPPPQSGDAPQV